MKLAISYMVIPVSVDAFAVFKLPVLGPQKQACELYWQDLLRRSKQGLGERREEFVM